MSDRRLTRLMGWIGLGILATVVVVGVLNGNPPNEDASGATDVAWMNAHSTTRWAQVYVIAVGLTLVLVFAAQLRRVLHDTSDRRQVWPDLVLAAGIVFVASEVATSWVTTAFFVHAAHNHDTAMAHLANAVDHNDRIVLLYGLALLTATSGLAVVSGSSLPRWLGVISLVIGIVCLLGPLGFFGVAAVFFFWFPVVGFMVAAEMDKPTPTSENCGEAILKP
jgi:hypothetical protein